MTAISEFGRKGLPRAIPADQLQQMLGSSQEFCSWDASNAEVSELMDRWPYLFSRSLLGSSQEAQAIDSLFAR